VLPTGTVLRANYGEGFKAPTLYQLFSDFGNRALSPEEAKGWEAGVEQRFLDGMVSFGATYFERRTDDQIVFASCAPVSTDPLCFQPGTTIVRSGYYQNVARAFTQGIEAVGRVKLGERLSIDGNYSWTAAEDRSPGSATFGKWLTRRPRNTANAAVSYALPSGASAGVAVRWSGQSFDNAANTTRLAPYTLVDLRAELPLTSSIGLFGRVENLFDDHYMTAYRYNTLGRSFYAGFRGRF
jgi:vitamin B12 transporter